jgi:hypothetical protein
VDRKTAGAFFPKVRANELPFLQKGSASVSLAVSRILRDTSSVVAALSKRRAQDEILTSHYNLSTKILDLRGVRLTEEMRFANDT